MLDTKGQPVNVSQYCLPTVCDSQVPVDVAKYAGAYKNTYIALVLDASGSMWSLKDQTLSGFNEQIDMIRTGAIEDTSGKTYASMIVFNHKVYERFFNVLGDKVTRILASDYKPEGGTALYDAVGYTIEKLRRSTNDSTADNAYLLVIMTDGYENQSKHFNREDIANRIKELQATGRWTFTYLGSNQDLGNVSKDLNIPIYNTQSYACTNAGVEFAASSMIGATKKYMSSRSAGGWQSQATSNFYGGADLEQPNVTENKPAQQCK